MENKDFINEGMDFLSRGKDSGRVKNFSDFLNEEENMAEAPVSDAPAIEPEKPEAPKKDAGFGDQPFFFAKNGDAGNYFFKVADRGFVLTIGKFSKFSQPTEEKGKYGVLNLCELPVADLDQAVIDNGKFEANSNKVVLVQNEISKVLSQVAICVSDYVQKNPSTTKFYDEIQGTTSFPDYDNKFAMSMGAWPGGTESWKLQVLEKGKLNTVSK